jgi:hypothetical protein
MDYHSTYLKNLLLFKKYNPHVNRSYMVYDGTVEREINGVRLVNWRNLPGEVFGDE